jgi:predicted heme/steroid binding protein
MLRPGYAKQGLPRGEVMLGSVSMLAVGISGALLTFSRIGGLEVLTGSPWGRLLSAKIALYLVMVSTALVAVLFIGPRLKKQRTAPASAPPDGIFDAGTLASFNAKDGRPAYIAYQGTVYDVSALAKWKGGTHMKHPSGTDLSDALGRAPHGTEKLDGLPVAGTYDPERKAPLTPHQKTFYVIAYLNLGLVFAVLFVISIWRWGI